MKILGFLLFFSLALGLIAGCGLNHRSEKNASGKYASEKRNDFGFREIKAGSAVILIITVGTDYDVTIEGEEKLLSQLKTTTEGERLIITTTEKITPDNKVRVKIAMPELLGLELWGRSEATVANVRNESLKLQIGGNSNLKIDGETKSLTVGASGMSMIDAENLKTEKTDANAAGASEITVFVSEELTAEALGSSTVLFFGEPKSVKPMIAGDGEIRKK